MKHIISLIVLCGILFFNQILAQGPTRDEQLERVRGETRLNTITTAVPFLMISPDSRAGAMADIGAATSPDANSTHWNNSKLAFLDTDFGASFSYTPWLRNIVPDMYMSYLSVFSRLNKQTVLAGSIRYFTLGDIQLTDEIGNSIQQVKPNETSIDASLAYKLSDNFSGGFALRYVFSDLTRGVNLMGESKPAQAIAADLNGFYTKAITVSDYDAKYNFGFNISNIGNRVSYSETARRDFIPINLRIGNGLILDMDEFNSLAFYFDINKLLVPTPPVYLLDDNLSNVIGDDGNPVVLAGKNPDVSVPVGMLQSFYDAPGGFREELREYIFALGAEYWYDKQFAMRTGFFYEDPNKGSRQYLTIGAGVKYEMVNIDFSYLVPIDQRNPLENTIRFSISIDLGEVTKAPKQN